MKILYTPVAKLSAHSTSLLTLTEVAACIVVYENTARVFFCLWTLRCCHSKINSGDNEQYAVTSWSNVLSSQSIRLFGVVPNETITVDAGFNLLQTVGWLR